MAVLDRATRDGLIARVASGTTTEADAALLERALPRAPMSTIISSEQVRDMREIWFDWRKAGVAHRHGSHGSGRGYGTLAEMFGVSASTARNIISGRTRVRAGGPLDCGDEAGALTTRPAVARGARR